MIRLDLMFRLEGFLCSSLGLLSLGSMRILRCYMCCWDFVMMEETCIGFSGGGIEVVGGSSRHLFYGWSDD